jgi:hypothetical protein
MKPAAVGFRVHSGWTALVAVTVKEGTPSILARERAQLVRTFTYEYRQPYHTAARMPTGDRGAFIARMRAEARRFAFRTICRLKATLEEQGYSLTRSGLLLASGRPLPELGGILASHSLIHTADGELFREAIVDATVRAGLPCARIRERELFDSAARTLGLKSKDVSRRIQRLGRPLGPPWSQDEKHASLVAWLAAVAPSSAQPSAKVATRGKARPL